MDAIKRYQNDLIYHSMVVTMRKLIEDGSLTGNDVIEAAEFACRMIRHKPLKINAEFGNCQLGTNDKWNNIPF